MFWRTLIAGVVGLLLGTIPVWPDEPGTRVVDEKRIEELIQLLGSPNFEGREQAQKDLVALGSIALPKLELASKSPDKEVARRAKAAVSEIERLIQEAISGALRTDISIDGLESPDPYVRLRAVVQLAGTRTDPEKAAAQFQRALADPDPEVRNAAVGAYARLADAKTALDKLVCIIRDDNENAKVRGTAVIYLTGFMPEAVVFLPDILRALRADHPSLRLCAASALERFGKDRPEAVAALLHALKDADRRVRGNAARSLGRIGKEHKRCVTALHECLRQETDSRTKHRILQGIVEFGADAAETIPTIVAIAKDASNQDEFGDILRAAAVNALALIGPAAKPHLEALAGAGQENEVGREAMRALERMRAIKKEKR